MTRGVPPCGIAPDRDREKPRGSPLPHHPAYGSVPGDSVETKQICPAFGPASPRESPSPFTPAPSRLHRSRTHKGQLLLVFLLLDAHRVPQPTRRSSVWAFVPHYRTTMPAADYCRLFDADLSAPSRFPPQPGFPPTGDSPPEVSSTTFGAQPPHLRPVPLMDMDFVI